MSESPSHVAMAEAVKRPASVLQAESPPAAEHPPKRHHAEDAAATTTISAAGGLQNGAVPQSQESATEADGPRAPSDVPKILSEEQLRGKDSEELIDTILQLQSAYTHNLATVSAQYAEVTRQLNEIKSCLSVFFGSASSSLDTACKHLRVLPPSTGPPTTVHDASQSLPTLSRQPAALRSFSHPAATPAQAPSRAPETPYTAPMSSTAPQQQQPYGTPVTSRPTPPPFSTQPTPSSSAPHPQQQHHNHPASQQHSNSPAPSSSAPAHSPAAGPAVEMPFLRINSPARSTLKLEFPPDGGIPKVLNYSTLHTVRDMWQEYKYGLDGGMAIEAIENQWQSRWRPDPKGRTWFSRRKIVWDKVRELIHDGLDEDAAVGEVEAMRAGRSMNWLINTLTKDRKETKASWKRAAAEATAAAANLGR